jgi:phosphatidylglycerophosphatase A
MSDNESPSRLLLGRVSALPSRMSLTDRAALLIGTVGGIGFLRPFPGTWGSMAGFLYVFSLQRIPQSLAPLLYQVVLFGLAIWSGGRCERILGKKDPSSVVIDEAVCVPITLLPILIYRVRPGWLWWVIFFIIYRVLDIIKPFPARRLESLGGGLGILLDDVVSASYGAVLVLILRIIQMI